ncbi:MAG: hypothetical protein Q9195_001651 [Heterodermia aff. obscurata]
MSALFALSGFVVQFVGLGAMHWSATVTVVSVSIFMTIVRAVVRRGLANDPRCIPIPEKIELVWVALRVARGDWHETEAAPSNSIPFLTPSGRPDCEWGLLTGFIEPRLRDGTSICDTKLETKQITNQNSNQDEKQDVKQDVSQDANLEANFITDQNSNSKVNEKVLEFNSKITDATRYMRQLNDLSPQKFVLGFDSVSNECPETKAIKDISSITPNIPLGDFHDLASKLAVAMKGIMDYLGEISGNEIIWQEFGDRPPFAANDWQIDVQQSLGVKTSWVIRTYWKKDDLDLLDNLKEDLHAGLSLWMHSIACTNSYLNRLYSCLDKLRNDKVSIFRSFREVIPKERGIFPRIVGSAGSKTSKKISEWVPYASLEMEDYTTGGLYNQTMLRTFTFHPPEVMPEVERERLDCVVLDDSCLEEECAREILSLFMLSICMTVECVKGETHRESGGMMTNTTFTELAEKIVQAGLADSTERALLYVIPAFAKFKLLPRIEGDELVTPRREDIGNGHIVESELRSKQVDHAQR